MNELPEQTLSELRAFAKSQLALVEDYEAANQIETAYLAKWGILERFVKSVASQYRKERLRQSLKVWHDYLEGDGKKPSDKLKTELELHTIPQKPELINALNYFSYDGLEVWKVMDSEGKPRRFRNEIAHTGRRFTRNSQYTKLGNLLDHAVQLIGLAPEVSIQERRVE